VTDGVESAVRQARAVAGEKWVAVASADVAAQCLDAGLLDQVDIDLVPVILAAGIPFFAGLATAPVVFEKPHVIEGDGVTRLSHWVRRTSPSN
jgi:dihydrofolate reductase